MEGGKMGVGCGGFGVVRKERWRECSRLRDGGCEGKRNGGRWRVLTEESGRKEGGKA